MQATRGSSARTPHARASCTPHATSYARLVDASCAPYGGLLHALSTSGSAWRLRMGLRGGDRAAAARAWGGKKANGNRAPRWMEMAEVTPAVTSIAVTSNRRMLPKIVPHEPAVAPAPDLKALADDEPLLELPDLSLIHI